MSKLPEHFGNTVEGYTDLNMLEEAAEECLRMVESVPQPCGLFPCGRNPNNSSSS